MDADQYGCRVLLLGAYERSRSLMPWRRRRESDARLAAADYETVKAIRVFVAFSVMRGIATPDPAFSRAGPSLQANCKRTTAHFRQAKQQAGR
jgi:hypothetical protein